MVLQSAEQTKLFTTLINAFQSTEAQENLPQAAGDEVSTTESGTPSGCKLRPYQLSVPIAPTQYSSLPLIETSLPPNNSVLITWVFYCERGD